MTGSMAITRAGNLVWMGSGAVAGRRNRAAEPGAGVGPVAVGRARRDAQREGGLVGRQAGEVAELDQLGLLRTAFREAIEGLVQSEKLLIRGRQVRRLGSSSSRFPLPPRP